MSSRVGEPRRASGRDPCARPNTVFVPAWEPIGNFQLYFLFTVLPSEDRITVNGSAYGMLRSKCFLRSAGRLTCTTCHDPHQKQTEAHFTAVCRTCHASEHKADTRDCARCHMPKRRTEDAVHVVMTDHRIRRTPIEGDPLAEIPERHDRHAGPVKMLYPPSIVPTAQNELYIALAQVRSWIAGEADIRPLERAITAVKPTTAEAYARSVML